MGSSENHQLLGIPSSVCTVPVCQVKTFPSTFCLCKLYRGGLQLQYPNGKRSAWYDLKQEDGEIGGNLTFGWWIFFVIQKNFWVMERYSYSEWMNEWRLKTVNDLKKAKSCFKQFAESQSITLLLKKRNVNSQLETLESYWVPTSSGLREFFLQADLGFQDLWRQLFEEEAPKLEVKALKVGLACGMEMVWSYFFRICAYIFCGNQTILYHRILHIWWCDSTRFVLNRYAESKSTRWRNSRKT